MWVFIIWYFYVWWEISIWYRTTESSKYRTLVCIPIQLMLSIWFIWLRVDYNFKMFTFNKLISFNIWNRHAIYRIYSWVIYINSIIIYIWVDIPIVERCILGVFNSSKAKRVYIAHWNIIHNGCRLLR